MQWRFWGQRDQSMGKPPGVYSEVVPQPLSETPNPAPVAAALPKIVSPITMWLEELHAKYKNDLSGELASYIPELTKADPQHFGIVLATADGQIYEAGDSQALFTIQSISKPFVYGLALEDHGLDHVMTKVGVEPTGEAFNSIVMDEVNNRPFNPMVNAGAIATTALVKGSGEAERYGRIHNMFERFAGRSLTVDDSVFQSERATGHRNRAIAFLQLNSGMIEEPVTEHLDLYFKQCSIHVSARDLAVMAATLAHDGINPLTGERAIASEYVKNVLSIMASCGMYDYSGEWVYRVGLPAKSGVGGGIIAVLPGQFGIGIFSPLLDSFGNSHRGIEVCKEISHSFHLHVYDTHFVSDNIVRRSYRGGAVTSKRQRGAKERKALDRSGHEILVYELQGGLYFATAEQLARRMVADAPQASFIVLDGRRIGRADTSALLVLRDMGRTLRSAGKQLVLAGLTEDVLADWASVHDAEHIQDLCFADLDVAIEHCENALISRAEPGTLEADTRLAIEEMDLLRNLAPAQIERLAPYLDIESFEAGERIIKQGDPGDRIFMLASGSASVSVLLEDGKRSARMAGFRPGVTFGEFALFDKGKRVADVIAETNATCFVLPFDRLEKLEHIEPDVYNRILFAIGRLMSERLRRVTAEVRALS